MWSFGKLFFFFCMREKKKACAHDGTRSGIQRPFQAMPGTQMRCTPNAAGVEWLLTLPRRIAYITFRFRHSPTDHAVSVARCTSILMLKILYMRNKCARETPLFSLLRERESKGQSYMYTRYILCNKACESACNLMVAVT